MAEFVADVAVGSVEDEQRMQRNDGDYLSAAMCLSFDSEHRLRSENLSFDIDVWYPLLKNFTFRSVFIPLKRREAEAIRSYHNVSWRHTQASLTKEDASIIKELETDISSLISSQFGSQGAFVRLCGRSPKDGEPLDRETPVQDYLRNIRDILSSEGSSSQSVPIDELTDLKAVKEIDARVRMAAISRVSWLRVKDGKEALSLLLTSERVYAEMVDWLKFGEPEQLCFRDWEPELKLEYEFRVFVHCGVLTAITQYDHYAYYPRLHEMKETLLKGIYEYWRMVHPHVKIGTGSYVVDIGYLPSSNKFILIELSPFTPCTGPALFNWRGDIDVIQGCNFSGVVVSELSDEDYVSRIEFRIKLAEDVHPQLGDLIEVSWDDRWLASFEPYWKVIDEVVEIDVEDLGSQGIFARGVKYLGSVFSSRTAEPAAQATKSPNTSLLFVYGTLKTGFQWNVKYLSPRLGAKLIGLASTINKFPLVIGDCGVPYLLNNELSSGQGHQISGELWEVSPEALSGLDDYEGISKGYYVRNTIDVILEGAHGCTVNAFVYTYNGPDSSLLCRPFLSEYTLQDHQQYYCPILHIQRKQMAYIGKPSLWGKTDREVEEGLPSPAN